MKKYLIGLLTLFAASAAAYETGGIDSVMRVPHAGGRPQLGSIDLSKSACVGTSVLGLIDGGTGTAAASQNAAFNALAPTSLKGDIIVDTGSVNAALAVGSDGNVLTADSSQTDGVKWAAPSTSPDTKLSYGIKDSVSSNALTINLTQSDGSTNPSAGSPVQISFRSSTLTSGAYNTRSITSSLSIVVPSSATLGQTSAVNQYVWYYALDDAGTVDDCVSGVKYFDEGYNQSSTQITSGSTSGTTLYCASSHTGAKPIRFLGRLLVNESTAGTWASAASDIQIKPAVTMTATEWATYTMTIGATSVAPTKASSPSTDIAQWRRDGGDMLIRYDYRGTSTGAAGGTGTYLFPLPSGFSIDSTKVTVDTNPRFIVGNGVDGVSALWTTTTQEPVAVWAYDTTDVALAAYAPGTTVFTAVSSTFHNIANTNIIYTFVARVPIAGWSMFGP